MPKFFTILLACFCLGACAATDSGYGNSAVEGETFDATPARVTFIDYSDYVRLNLVNMAHSDPVEFYSEVRTTASTKITYNEVFAAMLDYFDEQGFSRFATPGFAPHTATSGAVQALEVETDQGTYHLIYGTTTTAEGKLAYKECVIAWQEIFNRTHQAQAVSNATGGTLFDREKSRANRQNR